MIISTAHFSWGEGEHLDPNVDTKSIDRKYFRGGSDAHVLPRRKKKVTTAPGCRYGRWGPGLCGPSWTKTEQAHQDTGPCNTSYEPMNKRSSEEQCRLLMPESERLCCFQYTFLTGWMRFVDRHVASFLGEGCDVGESRRVDSLLQCVRCGSWVTVCQPRHQTILLVHIINNLEARK